MTSAAAANNVLYGALVLGQYDDELATLYDMDQGASPGHNAFNGIGRVGVRFDSEASGLNAAIKSVLVRFRKYGNPTGNITIGVRKASDDSLVTIGTWPIAAIGPASTEQSFVVRLRTNTYTMLANDVVSIEYPSNATNGLEISTKSVLSDPAGYTSRTHNGSTWSTSSNPIAMTIKG